MKYEVGQPSRILELYTQRELPDFLKCAHLVEVVIPTLKLLIEFLQKNVADKQYPSKSDLQSDLDQWPQYCQKQDFQLSADFSQLRLADNAINNEIVFCNENGECNYGFFIASVYVHRDHIPSNQTS